MTTKLKLANAVASAAGDALAPHIPGFYDQPGATLLAIVELEHRSRVEVPDSSELEPSVTARISAIEVPGKAAEDAVRSIMRGLYLLRTARGTLDEVAGTLLEDASKEIADGLDSTMLQIAAVQAAAMHEAARQLWELADTVEVTEAAWRRRVRKIADAIAVVHTGAARYDVPELALEDVQS